MRLLIIGRHQALFEFAVKVMREVPKHSVVGIITAPAKREYLRGEDDYRKLAASEKVPFLLARRAYEGVADFIDVTRPDMGVSLNWPTLLPAEIVNRFPQGIINAHFGDLPRYRGNGLGWALLRLEPMMTLTVYRMESSNPCHDGPPTGHFTPLTPCPPFVGRSRCWNRSSWPSLDFWPMCDSCSGLCATPDRWAAESAVLDGDVAAPPCGARPKTCGDHSPFFSLSLCPPCFRGGDRDSPNCRDGVKNTQ